MKKIALQTEMIMALLKGEELILFAKSHIYNYGDILGIKETHRFDSKKNIEYQVDVGFSGGGPSDKWIWSNLMDEKYIKRYCVVTKVRKTSFKKMRKEYNPRGLVVYNNVAWFYKDAICTGREWFRDRIYLKCEDDKVFYAITLKIKKDGDKEKQTAKINDFPSVK